MWRARVYRHPAGGLSPADKEGRTIGRYEGCAEAEAVRRVSGRALVGTTKPERIRESAAACDWEMSREEWYEVYLSAGHKLP
jgi:hypothetical protein